MVFNDEQKKIIQSKSTGHSLIKGSAGAGKTTVAVNRIPFLIKNYCKNSNDKILMVTFTKSLVTYIKNIYSNIDKPDDNGIVEFINIDKLTFRYFKKYVSQHKIGLKILDDSHKINIIKQCIPQVKQKYPDLKLIDLEYSTFLSEEIKWIKACNYTKLEEYQQIGRLGRIKALPKNSDVREAIYYLIELYNNKMKSNNWCDFEDVSTYALNYVTNYDIAKYTHIIVDESQDLSKVQLEFITSLYNNSKDYSSIMFISDISQNIYINSWLRNHSFASIGFNMTGRSSYLSKNYRTTVQIVEAAYSLIENDKNIISHDDFIKPSLVDRQGKYPVLKGFNSFDDELKYILTLINTKLKYIYKYNEIAIISRKHYLLNKAYDTLNNKLPILLYNSNADIEFKNDSVKLITMHSIKGLEFKVIIIIGLSDKVIPDKNIKIDEQNDEEQLKTTERLLLYVGMTRAAKELYMSYHGKKSVLLEDINPKFLRLNANSKIKSFYLVPFDNFYFTSKLKDVNSEKERVRQWLINELLVTYKYHLELIDIDYNLTFKSKVSLVDIVIFNYISNNKEPYIIISLGTEDLNTNIKKINLQLTISPNCQYGIITDGTDFIVIDRDYKITEDIPTFNEIFKNSINVNNTSSCMKSYIYLKLENHKEYKFLNSSSNKKEIIVNGIYIKESKLSKLNIISNIDNNTQLSINNYIIDNFYLPSDLIKYSESCFILEVKGDSMDGININDGDYIVINQQLDVQTNDIVAVKIGENTMLKEYIPSGSKILLMPKNNKYEAAFLHKDEFELIGVAIGVIKFEGLIK